MHFSSCSYRIPSCQFASTAYLQLSISNLCEAEMQERDIQIQIQTHMNFTFITPRDAPSMWLCHVCPLQTVCFLFGKTNFPFTGSCLGAVAQTKRGSVSETQTRGTSMLPSCVHRLTPLEPQGHVQSSARFWEGSSLFVSKQFRI